MVGEHDILEVKEEKYSAVLIFTILISKGYLISLFPNFRLKRITFFDTLNPQTINYSNKNAIISHMTLEKPFNF